MCHRMRPIQLDFDDIKSPADYLSGLSSSFTSIVPYNTRNFIQQIRASTVNIRITVVRGSNSDDIFRICTVNSKQT